MAQLLDRVAAEPWLRDEIVQKVPRGGPGDIRLGSPLIVQPGESAVFIRQGEPLATFGPGTHVLSTNNIPILGDLIERGIFGSKNVFTADVFFAKTTDMTLKWGTSQPIIVEHMNRPPGASAIVGNGTYVAKVKDPWRFLTAMDAFRDSVRQEQIKERLDPLLGVMLQDKLSELAIAKNLGPAQLRVLLPDLNELLVGLMQSEFDSIGMVLVDFNIAWGCTRNRWTWSRTWATAPATQRQMADDGCRSGKSAAAAWARSPRMMGMSAMQQTMQQQQQQQQRGEQQQGQQAAPAVPDVMTGRVRRDSEGDARDVEAAIEPAS